MLQEFEETLPLFCFVARIPINIQLQSWECLPVDVESLLSCFPTFCTSVQLGCKEDHNFRFTRHTKNLLFIIKYPADVVLSLFIAVVFLSGSGMFNLTSNSTSVFFISSSIKFDFIVHSNIREHAMIDDVITVIVVSICVCQPPF